MGRILSRPVMVLTLQILPCTPRQHLPHHRLGQHPVQALGGIFPIHLREGPQVRLGTNPLPQEVRGGPQELRHGAQFVEGLDGEPAVWALAAVGAGEFHGGFLGWRGPSLAEGRGGVVELGELGSRFQRNEGKNCVILPERARGN
jgi:hypothetical protein